MALEDTVSCWEDGRDHGGTAASSCLLPDGHDGEHEFTPDSQITLAFGAAPSVRDTPDPTREDET